MMFTEIHQKCLWKNSSFLYIWCGELVIDSSLFKLRANSARITV